MALKIIDINPVIDLVKRTIGASGINDRTPSGRSVATEADSLEVRVGLKAGYSIEVLGRVTMDVPSGYLVVRTESNKYTNGPHQLQYRGLMRYIAQDLSKQYEVAYITPLKAENIPKERDLE